MKNDIFHTLQSDYRYALICVKELRKAVFDKNEGLIAVDPDYWKDLWNDKYFNDRLDWIEETLRDRMDELKGNK